MINAYLRQDQACPNWKDILLVGEVSMVVSTMVGTTKKTMQFGIFVFVEAEETNWRGNLQDSKCDGDCIFWWNFFCFTKKFLFLYIL